jgi:hypothetical protein
VGEAMTIDVLEPGGIKREDGAPRPAFIRTVSKAGYDYCEKLYSRFGPSPIMKSHKDKFEMKEEFLEAFDPDSTDVSWQE